MLKRNLTSVFVKFDNLFHGMYNHRVLTNLDIPIESKTEEFGLHQKKLAFIVQNGFKAFFIYKKYNEMTGNEEDLELMKKEDD